MFLLVFLAGTVRASESRRCEGGDSRRRRRRWIR